MCSLAGDGDNAAGRLLIRSFGQWKRAVQLEERVRDNEWSHEVGNDVLGSLFGCRLFDRLHRDIAGSIDQDRRIAVGRRKITANLLEC